MKTTLKILFTWVAIFLLTLLIDNIANAQNNGTFKGIYSYNVSDTAAAKSTRTSLQTSQGSTGGLYFDKIRNKWRIWTGSKGAPTLDSSWVDLPVIQSTATGTVTSVSGTAPIAVATGTTTPVISMPAAGAAQAGYVNTASQTFGGVKTFGSPVFTGVPVAPTAAPGTNTTQIATTAFVQAAVPATITASNGLTKVTNDIQFGGTQSGNVTLSGATHDLTLDNHGTISITGTSTIFTTDDGFDPIAQVLLNAGTAIQLTGPTSIISGSNALNMTGSSSLFTGVVQVTPTGSRAGLNLGNNTVTTTTTGDIWIDDSITPNGLRYRSGGATVTPIDGTMVSTRVPFGSDANTLTTEGTSTFTYTAGTNPYLRIKDTYFGNPPWSGGVTNGIVSALPTIGLNIGGADGTAGTVTPAATTVYGGTAYTVSGNNQGGDVTVGGGLGRGTARNGDLTLQLNVGGHTSGYLKITGLPTSSAGLPSGAIWSNAGVLTIVP